MYCCCIQQRHLVLLVFVVHLVVISSIPLNQLHQAIATDKEELLRLFGTDSASTAPEYHVTHIYLNHSYHSSYDVTTPKTHYSLSAFGRDFHLELDSNNEFISKHLVVTRKKPGNIWTKYLFKPRGTFYQGHLISEPGSHAAVRDIEGSHELRGTIFSGGHIYQLHPLTYKIRKKLSLPGQRSYHVITKRLFNNTRIPGFFPEPITRSHQDTQKSGRQRRSIGAKYIESMILLDKISSDYYGNTSMDYILAVANMVHRLYRDPSIGINVSWLLTKIYIIETYEEGLDFKKQNIRSATQYMSKFSDWASPRNPAQGSPGHYDNGVLLSRKLCGLEDCALGGVAYSGVPCSTTLGFSVNNGNGIDAAFYVAHEMAHNFGIPHDSGACNKGYIMDPGQASGENAFKWSPCSAEMFHSVFSRVTCYDNKPSKTYEFPALLPGYKYDADKQCSMMNGPRYKRCPVSMNCALLFCYKTGSGTCSSPGTPPVDGTPCGKRKWCVGGKCEDVGSSVPPSVDGAWGAWGSVYSSCSRTCGVGVQYRTRKCNNPKPQFDGKPCIGPAIGLYKTCNKNACPVSSEHYRLYQCKQKNPSYKKYYIRGSGLECQLSCSTGSSGEFDVAGTVADGTKFNNDPLDHDICISGKRVDVGCDDEIGSGGTLDRCAKCLGDGTSCKRHQGLYDATGQRPGIEFAVPIVTVPAGATHFFIEEVSQTTNLLNMKLCPPDKNSRIFPDRPLGNTRTAAGTTIIYRTNSKTNLNTTESMSFIGPSNAALCPLYVQVLNEKNKGYKYSYYLPGEGKLSTYLWKTVPYGNCSEPCATGMMSQRVMCVRKDDGSEVSHKFCGLGNKPDSSIPCNPQPCKAKWEPELWSKCSKRCGGGERKRLVPCVQKVYPDIFRNVEYYYCNMDIRPTRNESCNQIDCSPSWLSGDWSKCVGGKSQRSIQCISIKSDGLVLYHNASMCNKGIIDVSPPVIKNCTVVAASNYLIPRITHLLIGLKLYIFTLAVT